MSTMPEFQADRDSDQTENKYDKARRIVSEIILQHQDEYSKIIERVNNRCQDLKKTLKILTDELEEPAAPVDETHSLDDAEGKPIATASLEELTEERIEEYQTSIWQLTQFSESLASMDQSCDELLKRLQVKSAKTDAQMPYTLQDISDEIFADQHQAILDAYEELQPGTELTSDLIEKLLPEIQNFTFANTLRDCDTALAYGSLTERLVSRFEIKNYHAETSQLLEEIADYTQQSKQIAYEVDIAASKAEGFDLELDEKEINAYENDSMQDLYGHYIKTMELLQERLAKATTYSEIDTLKEHGINILENAKFANEEVHAHIFGREETSGLLTRLVRNQARPDNPYFLPLLKTTGRESNFAKLIEYGDAMIDDIVQQQEAKLRGGIVD